MAKDEKEKSELELLIILAVMLLGAIEKATSENKYVRRDLKFALKRAIKALDKLVDDVWNVPNTPSNEASNTEYIFQMNEKFLEILSKNRIENIRVIEKENT